MTKTVPKNNKAVKKDELPDDALDKVAGGGVSGAQGGVPMENARYDKPQ